MVGNEQRYQAKCEDRYEEEEGKMMTKCRKKE
jgi:hypothetical protein